MSNAAHGGGIYATRHSDGQAIFYLGGAVNAAPRWHFCTTLSVDVVRVCVSQRYASLRRNVTINKSNFLLILK